VPTVLRQAFERHPFTPSSFSLTLNERFQARLFRESPEQFRFSFQILLEKQRELQRLTEQWRASNAACLLAGLAERLQQNVRLTYQSRTQLSEIEQDRAKAYKSGRRELENEFKKSTRFKSIRSLVDGDSGLVVRDLKPVWLMSPLSVADTVPLDPDFFDLVIFDEASQILTEEAVPSLVRGRQTIIVGDEMQLPPTQFFTSGESEDTLLYDDAGAVVEYDLNADSFLLHGSRVLPPTMLGWHYRSRHEALIGFSNAHFYGGRLHTVPDRHVRNRPHPPIAAEGPEMDGGADLLARRISFHFLNDGRYAERQNLPEAAYIARTVRSLLAAGNGATIGVLAFSEAQQTAIEDALDELAQEDADFRVRLEQEREREEGGEYVGLFVKNLENVQGDERDIIVISVCYGPDEHGKVRMNFGPINKGGGEKRLNVIFSRARHHMAIVSSIRADVITNEYNVGANCLKQFLEYAELVSMGRDDAADAILQRIGGGERENSSASGKSATVTEALARWLEEEGFIVDRSVGQSALRCDLAVRGPDDAEYRLGLLVEGGMLHGESPAFDRFVHLPGLLEAFGWQVFPVLIHDWQQRNEAVRQAILSLLLGKVLPSRDFLTKDATGEIDLNPERTSGPPPMVSTEAAPDFSKRLEYHRGGSEKFYEVTVSGGDVTVRFGRIGNAGQRLLYAENDASAALQKAEALLAGKLQKGYREVESR
jgi:predicted DNA-binding WGR domain protein